MNMLKNETYKKLVQKIIQQMEQEKKWDDFRKKMVN